MKEVWIVDMMESERGWGQDYWKVPFDTKEEAQAYYKKVNDANPPGPAPDYYVMAIGITKSVAPDDPEPEEDNETFEMGVMSYVG